MFTCFPLKVEEELCLINYYYLYIYIFFFKFFLFFDLNFFLDFLILIFS